MRPRLEVADIFRHHGDTYRTVHGAHMGRVERRVMAAIECCRTAALGGHVEACDDCLHRHVAYNSCRNRPRSILGPKCQGLARAEWLAELLPVPCFHVVFTVPAPVAAIAFHNKAVVYTILFHAAAETLKIIAADPRHLGAGIGFLANSHRQASREIANSFYWNIHRHSPDERVNAHRGRNLQILRHV